ARTEVARDAQVDRIHAANTADGGEQRRIESGHEDDGDGGQITNAEPENGEREPRYRRDGAEHLDYRVRRFPEGGTKPEEESERDRDPHCGDVSGREPGEACSDMGKQRAFGPHLARRSQRVERSRELLGCVKPRNCQHVPGREEKREAREGKELARSRGEHGPHVGQATTRARRGGSGRHRRRFGAHRALRAASANRSSRNARRSTWAVASLYLSMSSCVALRSAKVGTRSS